MKKSLKFDRETDGRFVLGLSQLPGCQNVTPDKNSALALLVMLIFLFLRRKELPV